MPIYEPIDKSRTMFKTAGPSLWDLGSYAESYWDAARVIAETAPAESLGAFPMAFLYRHALELMVKAVLVGEGPITGLTEKQVLDRSHSLRKQIEDLKRVLEHYGLLELPEYKFADLERLIEEWEDLDPDGFALRYSTKRDGVEPSNPKLGDIRINASALAESMDRALHYLSRCASEIDAEMWADIKHAEGIE